MKSLWGGAGFLLVWVLITAAHGDEIEGELIRVEKNGKMIVLTPETEGAHKQEEVILPVNQLKRLWGIENLGDLEAGESVAVSVEREAEGVREEATLEYRALEGENGKSAYAVSRVRVDVPPDKAHIYRGYLGEDENSASHTYVRERMTLIPESELKNPVPNKRLVQ